MNVYEQIELNRATKRKQLAVLVDPDRSDAQSIESLCKRFTQSRPDMIFVGGSLVCADVASVVKQLKSLTDAPVVLFPGNASQFVSDADALLLLSLISGRNAEYLIGQHVSAALKIRLSGIETVPTGYILIDGGRRTAVEYISATTSIPAAKPELAVATAVAGEMLGLKMHYLEAGSGAEQPVPPHTIEAVRRNVHVPLIVGGGIRSGRAAIEACRAGADIVVVGTAIEQTPELFCEICDGVHSV